MTLTPQKHWSLIVNSTTACFAVGLFEIMKIKFCMCVTAQISTLCANSFTQGDYKFHCLFIILGQPCYDLHDTRALCRKSRKPLGRTKQQKLLLIWCSTCLQQQWQNGEKRGINHFSETSYNVLRRGWCWMTNVKERCPLFTQRDWLTQNYQPAWSGPNGAGMFLRSTCINTLTHISHTHTCRCTLLIACNTSGFPHQSTELSECFIHHFCCCYPLPDCTWRQDDKWGFFSFILITE